CGTSNQRCSVRDFICSTNGKAAQMQEQQPGTASFSLRRIQENERTAPGPRAQRRDNTTARIFSQTRAASTRPAPGGPGAVRFLNPPWLLSILNIEVSVRNFILAVCSIY